jgi:hypothetical protein
MSTHMWAGRKLQGTPLAPISSADKGYSASRQNLAECTLIRHSACLLDKGFQYSVSYGTAEVISPFKFRI